MLRLYQSCSQGNLILTKGLILQFLMHVFLLYLVQVKKWLCRECWVIGQDRYTNEPQQDWFIVFAKESLSVAYHINPYIGKQYFK